MMNGTKQTLKRTWHTAVAASLVISSASVGIPQHVGAEAAENETETQQASTQTTTSDTAGVVAPGGVSEGLASWLDVEKSVEQGTVNNSKVEKLKDLAPGVERTWQEFGSTGQQSPSGHGLNKEDPASLLNFHYGFNSQSTNGEDALFETVGFALEGTAREVFSVQTPDLDSGGFPWEYGGNYEGLKTANYQNKNVSTYFSSTKNISAAPTLAKVDALNVLSKEGLLRLALNGQTLQEVQGNQLNNRSSDTSNRYYIGAGHLRTFNGVIGEMILFNRELSDTERQKVNSYLGLKYGLTLPHDYIASNGSVIWSAADNTGFGKSITGIGRDDTGALYQKQSTSNQEDAFITLALGEAVYTANKDNPHEMSDLAFFTFSDNGESKAFTDVLANDKLPATLAQTNAETVSTKKMARLFKVDQSNWYNETITLQVNMNAADAVYLYAYSNDDQAKVWPVQDGKVTLNGSDLPDGSYFTFVTHVDKKALEQEVAEAEALQEADYKAYTWGNLADKLAAAKAVLTKDNTQADVQTALDDLQDARLALVAASVTEGIVTSKQELTVSGHPKAEARVVDPHVAIHLAGINVTNLDKATVTINDFKPGDQLNFTNQAGIKGTFDTKRGILTLTGSTSVTNYEAALRSVTFSTTSKESGDRRVSFTIGSALYLPETGHFYEFVASKENWNSARLAAEKKRFFGKQGYLATITSAAETEFIKQKIAGSGWIGLRDIGRDIGTGTTIGTKGDWRWVTGPEGLLDHSKGLKITSAYGKTTTTPVTLATGVACGEDDSETVECVNGKRYTNWKAGEPNDGNGEWVGHIYPATDDANHGKWNDFSPTSTQIEGYVVEYGGMPNDPDVQLSDAQIVHVITAPAAPTNVQATALDGAATVTFTAPTNTGGKEVTSYKVKVYKNGVEQAALTKEGSASPITVDGLTNGTPYTFKVVAVNDVGESDASVASNAVEPITKAALQEAVNEQLKQADFKETGWAAYEAALQKAKDALANATTQKAINEAFTTLNNAKNALISASIKDGLATTDGKLTVESRPQPEQFIIDAGLTIDLSSIQQTHVDRATVVINNQKTGDQLHYTAQNGITGTYANNGVLTLTGKATVAQYEQAMRSVKFSTTSLDRETRNVSFTLGSALYLPATGHFYEFIESNGILWKNALTQAVGRDFFGRKGYLATITSAVENDFIQSKSKGIGALGGRDISRNLDTGAGTATGDWRWVTGPEGLMDNGKGLKFSAGAKYPSAPATCPSPLPINSFLECDVNNKVYTNWDTKNGEPNNTNNNEFLLNLTTDGKWNDLARDNATMKGYVVEYGGMSGDKEIPVSASKQIDVLTVPSAPTNVKATAGNGEVKISFTAPSNNGGTALTDYKVKVFMNNEEQTELATARATSPITVPRLANGVTYTFKLVATNKIGESDVATVTAQPVTKAALQAAVATGDSFEPADFKEKGWKVYEAALQAAKEVVASAEATQEAIEAALANLQQAKASLISSSVKDGITTSTGDTVVVKGVADGYIVDPAVTIDLTSIQKAELEQASVAIQNVKQGDTLSFTQQAGIEMKFNDTTGILTLTGTATVAAYEQAMRSVKFSTTSTDTTPRTIQFTIGSALYLEKTGHFYEFVPGAVTWQAAKTAAEKRSFFGRTGYLATITSEGENDFIREKTQGAGWIGLLDAGRNVSNGETIGTYGDWRWVTGPEGLVDHSKGLKITSAYGKTTTTPVTLATGVACGEDDPETVECVNGKRYTNWKAGEPNNGDGEWVGHIYEADGTINAGQWNDFHPSNGTTLTRIKGYVVEYGGMSGDDNIPLSASKTVTILTVPAAPTAVTATPGDGQVEVTFEAPTNTGGSAVTGYGVKVYKDGVEQPLLAKTGTKSPITVDGLTNGEQYTFEVVAINSVGSSEQPATSQKVEPVTTTALQNVIAEAKNLQEADYTTASWAAYQQAIAEAKTALAKTPLAQNDLNAAQQKIEKIKAGLVQTTELQQAVTTTEQEAQHLASTDYAGPSWKAYQDALKAAKDTLVNENATQAEVDEASTKLANAKNALVNTKALQAEIKNGETAKQADYAGASWDAYKTALDEANALLTSPTATQAAVDAAKDKLAQAQANLVHTAALQAKVTELASLADKDYAGPTWAVYEQALKQAQDVLQDKNATQTQVDAALQALTQAKTGLVKADDFKALQDEVAKVADLIKADYTDASWKQYDQALKVATDVLAKNPPAKQAEVEQALKALQDVTLIHAKDLKVQVAQDLKQADYTVASWQDYAKALKEAQDLLAQDPSATTDEIAEALKKLQAAQQALIKVPGAPTEVKVTSGNGQATVHFTPSAQATSYVVKVYVNGVEQTALAKTGTQSPITVTGLTNGTAYTFKVVAVNGEDHSADSASSQAVVPVSPAPAPSPEPEPSPAPNPVPNPDPTPSPSPAPTPGPTTEVITVDVVDDTNPETVLAQTEITRTDDNGQVKDQVIFTPEKAVEAVDKLADKEQKTSRIAIPDGNVNIAETTVQVPQAAVSTLVEADTSLSISTSNTKIYVPHTSMQNFTDELYFRIVPVKEQEVTETIKDNAVQNSGVQELVANTATIQVLGKPVTIQTNMQSRPVTITLPIPTDATEEQIASLFVYIEHSNGTTETKIGTIVDFAPGVKGVQFEIEHFSTFTLLYGELAKETITLKPYIQGYEDGTFKPNAAVTRAQIARMLARFLTDGNIPELEATFTDTATHAAKNEIEFVKQAGLFNGKTETIFEPNGTITRAQMAGVAARWIEQTCAEDDTKAYCEKVGTGKVFTDVSAEHWAAGSIELVSALGIMTGNSETTFNPNGTLTRAQAVKILNRLFERPVVETTHSTFSDVSKKHWAIGEIESAATTLVIER